MEQQSYRCASDYIAKTLDTFKYSVYYSNFCNGLTRTQVETKFLGDMENAIFDIDSDKIVTDWITAQKEFDLPILRTNEVDAFWIALEEIKGKNKRLLVFEKQHQEQLNKHYEGIMNNITIENENNVIEKDNKVVFSDRSLGSIIKSHGKRNFDNYTKLKTLEKNNMNLCLNGILDLTNNMEGGQKELFSNDEWNQLKIKFQHKNKIPKLSKETLESLEAIKKHMLNNKPQKAYRASLKAIYKSKTDTFIFKILAHVINAYEERSYIFSSNNDTATEFDYLAKIWCEVFELLFGKQSTMIVWGESVSRLTTNEKRNFNDDKANTIGFKVDARFIARPRLLDDKFIDTSNMEAAKCLDDANKVFNDKTKLAIETKILLDNFVCNCNPTSIKKLRVLNIQIGGTEAEVCYMFLADSGLYIHNYAYNISLPSTLTLFADNCIDWFRRLVSFKKSCLHLAELSKAFTSNHSPTFENIFSRESSPSQLHTTCNSSWVRGTFFPPTKADPIPRFPKHFLSSPVLASKRKEVDGSDKADVKKRK